MRIGFICSTCKKYVSCEDDPDHKSHCVSASKRSSNFTVNVHIPAGWGSKAVFDIETGTMIDDVEIKRRESEGKLFLGNNEIEQECQKNREYMRQKDIEEGHKKDEVLKEKIITKLNNS